MAAQNISGVSKDIWVQILPLVRDMIGASIRSNTIVTIASTGSSGSGGGGSDLAVHGLNSGFHTGTLADGQAPQFLKRDGSRSLTGNLSVTPGITIDGVDLSAHAADPDAHHDTATAGNGLEVTGQLFAIDLATNPGLEFSSGDLRVKVDTSMLRTASGIDVNEAHDFAWTGDHTFSTGAIRFNTNPQVHADIDFIGGDHEITASDDLTLSPTGDLWLNPTGLIMIDNSQEIRSFTIQDTPTGIQGIRIWERPDATNYFQVTMGAGKFDELYARAFVADEVRIRRGEEYWSKSFGVVYEDFTVPAIGANVDVEFEDSPALAGAIFDVGDWLLLRIIDLAGGTVSMKCWFQVQNGGGTDGVVSTDAINLTQTWRIKRKVFGTTGVKVKKGNTLLDAGVVGQGRIYLNALLDGGGPFFEIGEFTSVVADEPLFTERTRMGNLSGTVDYGATDTYGFVTGKNIGEHPDDPVDPFIGMTSDDTDGVRLFNTDLKMYDGGDLIFAITQPAGIKMLQDSTLLDNEYTYLAWYDVLDGSGSLASYVGGYGNATNPRLNMASITAEVSGVAGLSVDAIHNVVSGASAGMQLSTDDDGQVLIYTDAPGGSDGVILLSSPLVKVSNRLLIDDSFSLTSTVHMHDSSSAVNETVGLTIEQHSSGDAVLHWRLTSPNKYYAAGIDNSDGDKFKISVGTSLGVSDFIVIDPTSGTVTITGLDGGSAASGLIGGDGIDLIGSTIAVDSSVVRTTRLIGTVGALAGGGDLSADLGLSLTLALNSGLNQSSGLSVDLATTSGLNITSGLAVDDSIAGNGLTITSKVLNVVALSTGGLIAHSNDIAVKLPSNSGLVTDSTGLYIDDGIAGLGLTMASGVMDVDLATTSGLNLSSGLALDDSVAGAGMTITSKVLNVIALSTGGMTVNANDIAIKLPGASGLVTDATGLYIDDAVAGAGLVISSKVLAVGAGSGITVNANDVAIHLGTNSALNTSSGLVVDTSIAGAGLVMSTGIMAVGAGSAITVNANDIAVNLGTNSALNVSSGLVVDTSIAGAGLTMTSGVVNVIALSTGGLTVNTNDVQIKLPVASGLITDATGLYIDDLVAGSGLGISSKVLSVNVSNGLEINSDNVRVNQAFAFTWTGNHTWNTGVFTMTTDFQLDADLDFVGPQNITTTSGALTIAPTTALVLSPVSAEVLPTSSLAVNLGAYNRKWKTLFIGELYAETLVAQSVMATIGGRVIVAPTNVLVADLSNVATTINVKYNNFVNGSYIFFESAPGGVPQFEAMKVTSGVSGTAGNYTYTVTRNLDATGANAWVIGDACIDTGSATGMGYLDMAATTTLMSHIGPTLTVYARSSTSTWNSIKPVVTMGNLDSFLGYGVEYGFAVGNDLTLTPSTGFSGLSADRTNGIRLYNTPLEQYIGSTKKLKIDNTNGIYFKYGTLSPDLTLTWTDSADTVNANYYNQIVGGDWGGYNRLTLSSTSSAGNKAGITLTTDDTVAGLGSMLQLDSDWVNLDYMFSHLNMDGLGNVSVSETNNRAWPIASTFEVMDLNNNTGKNVGLTISQAIAGDALLHFRITDFSFTDITTWTMGIDNSDSDQLKIGLGASLGSADMLVIDTSGNVGIGVSTVTDIYTSFLSGASPRVLQINEPTATAGTSRMAALILSSNKTTGGDFVGAMYFANLNGAGADKRIAQISGFTGTGANDGLLLFATSSGGVITEAMRIDENGALGIGNTTLLAGVKLDIEQKTIGNPVVKLSSTSVADDPSEIVYQNRVATTNATPTTLHTFTVPATTTYMIIAYVVARRTGGASGTAEDGAGYLLQGVYKNVAGAATFMGLSGPGITTVIGEAQSAWDATLDVTGATVRVRVTGAASNNISWVMTARVYQHVG